VSHADQLEWERRAGRFAAAAAFLSALLGFSALVVGSRAQGQSRIEDAVDAIVSANHHRGAYLATGFLQAASFVLLGIVLLYLFRAARYRRPAVPAVLGPLAIAISVLVGIQTIVSSFNYVHIARDRVIPKLPLPPKAATDLVDHETLHGSSLTILAIGVSLLLVLAVTIGMISMQARRAGLLSQFMSILGVIAGALIVLGGFLQLPPMVQYFWLAALGFLFLERWPRPGRGPAWSTGEADPWPTAAEVRAEQDASRLGRAPDPEPEPEEYDGDEDEPVAAPAGAQHPRSKKRKRKRRR
jgi:hypothetical protein